MPRISEKNKLLDELQVVRLDVLARKKENLLCYVLEDMEDDLDDSDTDDDLIFIPPPTPISPLPSDDESESDLSSESESDLSSESESDLSSESESIDSTEARDQHYEQLLGAIEALEDEIQQAQVLHNVGVPMMHASQLQLLDHFAEFRPHLFRQKVCVHPDVFDCILDQISDNAVFKSRLNHLQIPVAIQLAIFLNCAGHYGNTISTEDVAQWAGISTGSVINCTNRVMLALLVQHDEFVFVPSAQSEDAELAHTFVEARSCSAWKQGIFAADGSTFNLFEKPSLYGETFYDRKSRYSLNCQVWK